MRILPLGASVRAGLRNLEKEFKIGFENLGEEFLQEDRFGSPKVKSGSNDSVFAAAAIGGPATKSNGWKTPMGTGSVKMIPAAKRAFDDELIWTFPAQFQPSDDFRG